MKAISIILVTLFIYSLSTNSKNAHLKVKEKVQIEVWSDVICPYCFLGKKKLDKAIAKLDAEDQVEIIFRSFQLTPEFPKNQSISSVDYYKNKGFSMKQMEQMAAKLTQKGEKYGIDYNFEKTLLFNSFDAHRLILWAGGQEKAGKLKEALLKAYFTDGYDLSKKDVLCKVVKNVGLDDTKAMEILNSQEYADKVADDINKASSLNITGVPFLLINGKEMISGAQNDRAIESIISNAINSISDKKVSKQSKGICIPKKQCN